MLAKSLSDKTGHAYTSSQVENKFRYYEGKYHKAKLESQKSGFGCSEEDKTKGIHSIDQKLESMCASFALWDSWFGSTQKYSPASVISSMLPDDNDDDHGKVDASEFQVDSFVNDHDGGDDGQADDAMMEREESAPESPRLVNEGVTADMSPSATLQPVLPASSRKNRVARLNDNVTAAVAGMSQSANVLMTGIARTPGASVPSSSSKSGSSSFDSIYAAAQANKSNVYYVV